MPGALRCIIASKGTLFFGKHSYTEFACVPDIRESLLFVLLIWFLRKLQVLYDTLLLNSWLIPSRGIQSFCPHTRYSIVTGGQILPVRLGLKNPT